MKINDEAASVGAEDGTVFVDRPGGVTIAFTPEAAMVTSDRLLAAGAEAHGQQVLAARPARERYDLPPPKAG